MNQEKIYCAWRKGNCDLLQKTQEEILKELERIDSLPEQSIGTALFFLIRKLKGDKE